MAAREGDMDTLAALGRTLGFSFAAGINLYATIAVVGLAARYDWVALPPQYEAFAHPWIIGAALALYAVEFVADKVPWVDTLWDAVHTVVRPLGGALIAVTALGETSPAVEALVALLGGTVAAGTHLTKAGARVAANTSPEPLSNWTLSLGEDLLVVALGLLALQHPVAALAIVVALLVVIALLLTTIVRLARRRWTRRAGAAA
jgi:hypothetical protein